MQKPLITALFLCAPATAFAGGSAGSIGVGVELNTLGDPNLSGVYDFGQFHLGAQFGYEDQRPGGRENNFRIGAIGYFHLHSTALADFSVGGEFHVETLDNPDVTLVEIAGGFQIRSFISTNVALSFTGGFVIGTSDSDGVSISGFPNPVGAAGVHYYFF